MNQSIITGLLLSLLFVACGPAATSEKVNEEVAPAMETSVTPTFADLLETAHAKEIFRSQEAIQFDLDLTFGGKKYFEGTITLSTDSGRGLLADGDGNKLYYLQDSIYYAPDDERSASRLRFSAYTWPYFFLLPYKLNDGGTNWTDYPDKSLNGKDYLAEKLTFDPGTGDAPDDWYILYADPETQLTQVAAYIVTAGKSQEEAEEDPHAIEYKNYQMVNGIPIAHDWTFWAWRTEEGLTNQLGNAVLSNVQFVPITEETFAPPADFING